MQLNQIYRYVEMTSVCHCGHSNVDDLEESRSFTTKVTDFPRRLPQELGPNYALFRYFLRQFSKSNSRKKQITKFWELIVVLVKTVLFSCPKTAKQVLQSSIRLTIQICSKCEFQFFTDKTINLLQNSSTRRKVTWQLALQKIFQKLLS